MKFSNEEILETVGMIAEDKLDIRTVTLGISLLDCSDPDPKACARKIRNKILANGEKLGRKTDFISEEYGLPIVNKRISLTPMSLVVPVADAAAFIEVAAAVDKAAEDIGVDFVGGYTAMIQKGETAIDRSMIAAMPEVLSMTRRFCASVVLASTKAGINMDGCYTMSQVMKDTASRTAEEDGIGCAKLVLFANPVDDNPFMAGAYYGAGESESSILVGVSGPGAVRRALEQLGKSASLGEVAEAIKKTAFKVSRAGELVGKKIAKELGVSFANLDLSLAPTPAEGDSVGQILETIGLEMPGAPGSTAALMMLNDAVKKGGLFASSSVGGLSGAFIPVSEDASMIRAAKSGAITLEKLEAMTSVCSVGLDMIAIPGHTSTETLAAIIADEMAIGCANSKTTAVRIIPAPGKNVGDFVHFGGLLGKAPVMAVSQVSADTFVKRGGRIPAPLQSLKN
ncbi:PFL family protein [Spirochaetota bacterium]